MKQTGKILLSVLILFMYIGIIYFGVNLVLKDTKVQAVLIASDSKVGMAMEHERARLLERVECTMDWVQQELMHEKQMEAYLDKQISSMTMEQKLAQMMILTNEKDITAVNMQTYQPGGIIFFEVDFKGKTVETVRNRVDILQSYMNIPLFVGVDEEGGEVSRLKTLAEENLPVFEGARTLCEDGMDAVQADTATKTEYLKRMGINLNFAPVADVVTAKSSYMYGRSASKDAEEVSEYVKTVLSTMQEHQVMGCIKHFPGYGDNTNTHEGFASDARSLSEYQKKDFLPFQAGIEAGVDMVMVSHIVMKAVDDENPASLSAAVHDILREDFAFRGVIITDDLNMQAILKTMTIEEATAKAFAAGNDMVFSADFQASMRGAKKAVEQGSLSEQQVDESVKRILRMKLENGLLVLDSIN